MKIKIAQVIESLAIGGAEKMCVQLANLFSKDCDVTVIYFHSSENDLINQLEKKIKLIRLSPQKDFTAYIKLARILNSNDIIHVHMRSALRHIYIANLFKSYRRKVVFHDHTNLKTHVESLQLPLIPQAIKNYRYVAVFEKLRNRVCKDLKINYENTKVIMNFVSPIENNMLTFERYKTGKIKLLCVGNFRQPKNHLFLIALLCDLRQRGIEAEVTCVGKVIDVEYFENFLNAINFNELNDFIKIDHSVSNILAYDKVFNLGLMISEEESGPLVLIEYLIAKLPFLSHGVGEVTKKIAEYFPEMVIDNLDCSLWAERMLSLVNSKFDSSSFQDVYKNSFSPQIAIENWNELYQNILELR